MLRFPEELLLSILALVPNPAVLLRVCSSFYRIAAPLLYHSISLHSPSHLHRLLFLALRPNPLLASFVRRISLPAIWPDAGELLFHCTSLTHLDVTLDSVLNTQALHPDAELFCRGLLHLHDITHITLRKPNNVYLTRPNIQYVLLELSKAIHLWSHLEYVDLAFRLSDDSGGTAALLTILPTIPLPIHLRPRSSKLPGPVTHLTQALSSSPSLLTFSTHLPNVWNENILRVSQNQALNRIILVDYHADQNAIMIGTGHFLAQARKHPRLADLIRAGTSNTRCRVQTTSKRPWSTSSVSPFLYGNRNSVDDPYYPHPWERNSSSSSLSSTPGPKLSSSAP